MRSAIITIGELSKRTGVHIETIRYYERVKLLPDPPRSRGNRRLYDENHLKRLTLIARARELGFSLGEIRALLALADAGNFTCDEMRTLTLDHLESVRAKIANLQRLEVMLADVASKCRSGKAPDCPILDALYDTGRRSLFSLSSLSD